VKQKLLEILDDFGYPVFLQGSLSEPGAYPDSFFTFWNFENPEGEHYDNSANLCVWGFWVYFYSVDPALVASVPEQARRALKNANFLSGEKPADIRVDVPTHTGAMFPVYGIENYTKEEN
jgi:hypothetical protein